MDVERAQRKARDDALVTLLWLLKDFGWVLTCGVIVLPTTTTALCFLSYSLFVRWATMSTIERVSGVTYLCWLSGNACWLAAEMLFEPVTKGEATMPWYDGPLYSSHPKYSAGVLCARFFFTSGLAVLLVFYIRYAYVCKSLVPRKASESATLVAPGNPLTVALCVDAPGDELVFGIIPPSVYEDAFVGPWILKDLFWTMQLLEPGLLCGLVALLLVTDCVRRYGGPLRLAEVFWVMGNVAWLCGEEHFDDQHLWPRALAASFMALGILLALRALSSDCDPMEYEALSGERRCLLQPRKGV